MSIRLLSIKALLTLLVDNNSFAGFTFLQTVINSMVQRNGQQGGSVLVTGATSSTRGREGFAGFAASKSGLRAICQSVAREFGPKVRP